MTAILDDLDTDLEPKCIGRCSIVPPSSSDICSKKIYEGDIEYVELERGKGLACADCVKRLLATKRVSEEPEKDSKKFSKQNKRTGARLSQGPQGRVKGSK